MIPAFYNEFYDAEQEELREELARERRTLRDESDPFELLPDEEFRKLHRLTKELAQNLIAELEPYMAPGQRNTKLPLDLRVLAALRFFAHGSYQKCIGANQNVYVAQQTMSDIIREVCNAIENIAPRYIKFPTTAEEIGLKKEVFWNSFNFPGIVGCVDGTHVAIVKPNEDEHLYLNRKGYHSKNVQIICDADLTILSINPNFGGATHDSFIWRNSAVKTFLEQNYRNGDHNTWLLGDSGYPQQPWLMTPIRNAQRDSPESRYNDALVSARCTVERCIGVLKMRFRCTHKERVLRYAPFKAGQIINCCAVLHNICIMGNVPLDEEDEENESDDDDDDDDDELRNNAPRNVVVEGQRRRQQLVNAYFQ